jgi:hypothetical protein
MIKSRRLRWARHIACMAVTRNAYRLVVGKYEGKRSYGYSNPAEMSSQKLSVTWVRN